ncbi:Cu(I)-responsive transcriptional regulator [Nitrincola sp. MINF-07-Sa-05]|uniref:Cu(I)-responsive transcriptional regulator n=1 Tax=Nitrincola salilacus TaxID=3400273 RepID=UPI0039181B9C
MMNIGEAASASGVSAKMVRYYESIGLLQQVRRSDNGYRLYSGDNVQTLIFIRRARRLGFSVPQIERLVQLWQNPERTSADVRAVAQHHIQELQDKIQELEMMKQLLEGMISRCHGDDQPECPILEDLSRHDAT